MTAQNRPDELIRILRAEFVTKGGGVPGALCVAFTCGATGWRASGGTIDRTLVHETAFQLDTGGNARGAYSIDLQQVRNNANQVPAADHSLTQGYRNRIDAGADYSLAQGGYNDVGAEAYACWAVGFGSDIDVAAAFPGGQYLCYVFGENHDFDEANYVFVFGSNNDVIDEAFGAYSFGENNDFEATNASDYPTYTGQYAALGCIQKGDVWSCFQTGEDNIIEGTGGSPTQWVVQHGLDLEADKVMANLIVGNEASSLDPDDAGYYSGRFVLNNGSNDFFASWPFYGMNQSSIFSQEELISTWNVAWTTSFEFPILQDCVWYFRAVIVGTESGAANSYCWILEGFIENDGGTTTLLASTATVNYYRDVATKEWQVLADDPNDRLIFQFRDTAGPDATQCNIQMQMLTTEVGND